MHFVMWRETWFRLLISGEMNSILGIVRIGPPASGLGRPIHHHLSKHRQTLENHVDHQMT